MTLWIPEGCALCPRCGGEGTEGPLWSDDYMRDCRECDGAGFVRCEQRAEAKRRGEKP